MNQISSLDLQATGLASYDIHNTHKSIAFWNSKQMDQKIEKTRQAHLEYLDRMQVVYSDLQLLMVECLQVMESNVENVQD